MGPGLLRIVGMSQQRGGVRPGFDQIVMMNAGVPGNGSPAYFVTQRIGAHVLEGARNS